MGGTVPSIRPPKTVAGDGDAFPLRKFRGDTIGAGGVCAFSCEGSGGGAGGVGTAGAGVAEGG